MSRPLITDPKQRSLAAKFHADVFAMFGGPKRMCFLCDKPGATDAAHVVSRTLLGPHRYADPRLARPAHRTCHDRQTRHEIEFSPKIRREAIKVANALCRVKIPEVA
jgi:hypothetical protein